MSHLGRSMEGSGSEDDLNCGGMVQEGAEEMNIRLWPRHCFCDVCQRMWLLSVLAPKICVKLN